MHQIFVAIHITCINIRQTKIYFDSIINSWTIFIFVCGVANVLCEFYMSFIFINVCKEGESKYRREKYEEKNEKK
jgi:hypothetical protein